MNLTPLRSVNNLHRHELDPCAGGGEGEQLLGFDFKLRRAQVDFVERRQPQ
ncbi:MAG TPA: hypothetical protein VK846_18805 [Candidatus Limnocylindria bacterium]|nr:hypothetical protein [Candidatus Limnocylindria bacterium]